MEQNQKTRKSDKQKVLDIIKIKQRQSNVEAADNYFEIMKKELSETKKHYLEFRKKVSNLDLTEIVDHEKSFCVFGGEHQPDSEILSRLKKYKNCHPDDVAVLRGLSLKLSNYLLKAEGEALVSVRKTVHQQLGEELKQENKVLEINLNPKYPPSHNTELKFREQLDYISKIKKETIELQSQLEQSQSFMKSILDQIVPKSSTDTTDFDDIDEDTQTSAIDIQQIGSLVKKHLESSPLLSAENESKKMFAGIFENKRIQHNQSLIKQKREISIAALQLIDREIKEINQENFQTGENLTNILYLDDTIDLQNQSKMIDSSFSQFCTDFATNIDDRSNPRKDSKISHLQDAIDQLQSSMKQQASMNEKMLQGENEKLNSSLSVINQQYQSKSSLVKPQPDTLLHQQQIKHQNQLFSDVIQKLKMQLENESKKANKQPIQDKQQVKSTRGIMVSASVQTNINQYQQETQTNIQQSNTQETQTKIILSSQTTQTLGVKSKQMECQTLGFYGVLTNPVEIATQTDDMLRALKQEKECQVSLRIPINTQKAIGALEITQTIKLEKTNISKLVDEVLEESKKTKKLSVYTRSKSPLTPSGPQTSLHIQANSPEAYICKSCKNSNSRPSPAIQPQNLELLSLKLETREMLRLLDIKEKESCEKEEELQRREHELGIQQEQNANSNKNLALLSQQIKDQQLVIIEKIKQQNVQKLQIEKQNFENQELKEFLVEKENDQNYIDQELENERQQLEEEYKDLFHKMEFVRQNELEMQRQIQKVEKQKSKVKEQKRAMYEVEKHMFVQERQMKEEARKHKTYLFGLLRQDTNLKSLEDSLEALFEQIAPEVEEGEEGIFGKERDEIMIQRYNLEELKRAMNGLQTDENPRESKVEHPRTNKIERLNSEKTLRAHSQGSNESNLSYMNYRQDRSFEIQRIELYPELGDIKHLRILKVEAKKQSARRLTSHMKDSLLPRFSRNSKAESRRQSALQSSFRPSQRASAAPGARGTNARSTLWPKSVMSQIDDVDEEMNMNALVAHGQEDQNDENGQEEFFFERKSDTLMKEISFNALTQTRQVVEENSAESCSSESSLTAESIKQPPLESPLASPRPDEPQIKRSASKVSIQVEQASQVDDLPKPDLDLSAYQVLGADAEADKSTISVSVAMQVGESLRQSRSPSPARETLGQTSINSQHMRNLFGGAPSRPTTESRQSQPSFRNSEGFGAPQQQQLATPQYQHKKLDKFNRQFMNKTSIDKHLKVANIFYEGDEDKVNDVGSDDPDNEGAAVQEILDKSTFLMERGPVSEGGSSGAETKEEPFSRIQENGSPQWQKQILQRDSEEESKVDTRIEHIEQQEQIEEGTQPGRPMRKVKGSSHMNKSAFGLPSNQFKPLTGINEESRDSFTQQNFLADAPGRDSMKSNISTFTVAQLQDFEKIGLSGELFKEVRQYYKTQGKSKEQMQTDLVEYQRMIEEQIQKDLKKKDKKHKHKDKDKEKKDKSHKKKDKDKQKDKDGKRKSSKRVHRSSKTKEAGIFEYEAEAIRDTVKEDSPNVKIPQQVKEQLDDRDNATVRFSQRKWIFDDDSHEESVFIEKFKIQDREKEQEESPVKMEKEQEEQSIRSSRFSISFAQEEPSLVVVEEDPVVPSPSQANPSWYKESLINQIQSSDRPFGQFGERVDSAAKVKETQALWTITEEPGADEAIAAAENFRQTEDDEVKNKIGAPFRGQFVYPPTNNLPSVYKQTAELTIPDQPSTNARKSINFFKNLSSQSQSRQKLLADRKSGVSQTSEENFRVTERVTAESKRQAHPGMFDDQPDENNQSFRQSFETQSRSISNFNDLVMDQQKSQSLNFGSLIQQQQIHKNKK